MAKVYLKLVTAPSGRFDVMHIIYFSFVHRMEAVGYWMISACTILTRQYSANVTESRQYCWGCECENLQKKQNNNTASMCVHASVCVFGCVKVRLNVSPHISFRLIMISTSWHVLIVYLLKGTKHNATTTINNFLNSDSSRSCIVIKFKFFFKLQNYGERDDNGHM